MFFELDPPVEKQEYGFFGSGRGNPDNRGIGNEGIGNGGIRIGGIIIMFCVISGCGGNNSDRLRIISSGG